MSESHERPGFRLDRLAALSDGVIAIAITLLVLGLEVPSAHDVPDSELADFLLASLHPALGFVVSFTMIGTYWLAHYSIFHFLNGATRSLVVLNGLFLMCLSFVPFPTGLQAVYRGDELAMLIYCAAQALCGMSLLSIWQYAIKDHRLVDKDLSPIVARSMTLRLLIATGLSVLAMGLSFASVWASRAVLLCIPCLFLSHRIVDVGWQRKTTTHD